MRFANRMDGCWAGGFLALSLLASACGGSVEEKGKNPTSDATGTKWICLGQVVAKRANGANTEQLYYGTPSPAWDEQAGARPTYNEVKFMSEVGKADPSSLCGLPSDSKTDISTYIDALLTWSGAVCICQKAAVDLQTTCDDRCESMLANNPAYKSAPGTYACENDDSLFAPSLPFYAHNSGIACKENEDPGTAAAGRTSSPLTAGSAAPVGSSGGLTQFIALAHFHLNAGDGAVQSDGVGVIQYSADISDNCVNGCDIVVNRISMAFDDTSYSGYTFTSMFADLQDPLDGVVAPNGEVSIPANASKFVVGYTSNGKVGNFVDGNRSGIGGSFDAVTGKLTLSSIIVKDDDLTASLQLTDSTVIASPPRPAFAPTGTLECNARFGRQVEVTSEGSYDPDGDLDRFHWVRNNEIVEFGPSTTIFFGLGNNEIALNAIDARGALNYKRDTITVVDTTPPVWMTAPPVDLTSCDKFVDRHVLVPPPVSDVCTDITDIHARIVKTDGVRRAVPLDIDYNDALLPGGEHVIEWIATDTYNNVSSTLQTVTLGPAIVATNQLSVRDRAKVQNQTGALAAVGSTGTQMTQLGVKAQVAEALSIGPMFLQSDARVLGRAASTGAIQLQAGASVGQLQQFAPIPLGSIPWLAPYVGTTFGSGFVSIEPGTDKTIANGAYGSYSVKTRATLTVNGNSASFQSLTIEPGAKVILTQPETTLLMNQGIIQRGTIQGSGSLRIVVFGNEARFEAPVVGTDIIAPNAVLTVATTAHGTRVRQLVGRNVEIQPDVTLTCDRTSTMP